MKILGQPIFAKNQDGSLNSRIGTIFFRTPGLVTQAGVHAMQRMLWIDTLNAERAKEGKEPLTIEEEEEELSQSVDLVFSEEFVFIRPDPSRMDLALRADEELQKLVSKIKIRFLNTHSIKVRNALRSRGENWRLSRHPISVEDMVNLVKNARVEIKKGLVFYYNPITGTRWGTVAGAEELEKLPMAEFRAQLKEGQELLSRRNRLGHPEVDLFPPTTPIDIKQQFRNLKVDSMSDEELLLAVRSIDSAWRMSLPAELREENVDNYEWRNAMCQVLTQGPNETMVDENDLIQGISSEFYRQIEWLPGARVDNGEVIFDQLWDDESRTEDPQIHHLCDPRVRNILFNLSRMFGDIEYVNIGRVVRSLARNPIAGSRRGYVYVIQYKELRKPIASTYMIRFQKWGIAERLDEGKDLLTAIIESNDYADYIMDRRLMCQQLGMNLPSRIGFGAFTEPYHGENKYKGMTVRAFYYMRSYIGGTASDKVPSSKFHNPVFAKRFAELMGEAAAIDLIVGRRSTETKENLFDKNYEVVQIGSDGLPTRVLITDHAGSFVNYLHSFEDSVVPYANVIRRRKEMVSDFEGFASSYVDAFCRKLEEAQLKYRNRRRAFDDLFVHRPYDASGSGAYRWAKILERLDKCEPQRVANALAEAIHM